MKLQPSGDRILIQYAGLPGASREKRTRMGSAAARVVAVGPGQEGKDGHRVPIGVKVGQRVVVKNARGISIRLNRQSYALIRATDVVQRLK